MQSFKNKYYVTDDDIYLINKFSILVLGSFLMANIVVFVHAVKLILDHITEKHGLRNKFSDLRS